MNFPFTCLILRNMQIKARFGIEKLKRGIVTNGKTSRAVKKGTLMASEGGSFNIIISQAPCLRFRLYFVLFLASVIPLHVVTDFEIPRMGVARVL